MSEEKDENRPFRISGGKNEAPCTIPWWLAEIAYRGYRYGQPLERIHERGGFSRKELIALIRDEYDKL